MHKNAILRYVLHYLHYIFINKVKINNKYNIMVYHIFCVLFVQIQNLTIGDDFMNNDVLPANIHISTLVNFKIKKRLYEIAQIEGTTISAIVRQFIEKGVEEYERERN